MRILATDFLDTTYIFFLSSNVFFLFVCFPSQARCIHDQSKDFGGKDTEVNQPEGGGGGAGGGNRQQVV